MKRSRLLELIMDQRCLLAAAMRKIERNHYLGIYAPVYGELRKRAALLADRWWKVYKA